MQTFKSEVNGKVVYYRDVKRSWDVVYLCDMCEKEMEREESIFISISIAFGKTRPNHVYEIHPECFTTLVSRMRNRP